MSKILSEILAANRNYVETFGTKGTLALPLARQFAILTCMDARLDPAKFAGLNEGDAHVIRNAGGRASDDAIRSLVISHKLLGTREWFVIHHTDCGMALFKDSDMRRLLRNSLETAQLDQGEWKDVGKGPDPMPVTLSTGSPSTMRQAVCCRMWLASVVIPSFPLHTDLRLRI
jgi:carbonic anhydrase